MTINITDRGIGIEEENSVGNSMEVTPYRFVTDDTERLNLVIDNPWSGDTETGFGRQASVEITSVDALQLGEWLIKWAKTQTEKVNAA